MTSMTTAQLAQLVTGHIAAHGLPEPVSVTLSLDQQDVRVQLDAHALTETATGLLVWANTQAAVTLEVWRPVSGGRVHLHLTTTLTGDYGTAALLVYGAVKFDPAVFGALEPRETRPVSLGRLVRWAAGAEVAA